MTAGTVIRMNILIGQNFKILKTVAFWLVEKIVNVDKICCVGCTRFVAGLRVASCGLFAVVHVCIEVYPYVHFLKVINPVVSLFSLCFLTCFSFCFCESKDCFLLSAHVFVDSFSCTVLYRSCFSSLVLFCMWYALINTLLCVFGARLFRGVLSLTQRCYVWPKLRRAWYWTVFCVGP